jgi:hypothetical protein
MSSKRTISPTDILIGLGIGATAGATLAPGAPEPPALVYTEPVSDDEIDLYGVYAPAQSAHESSRDFLDDAVDGAPLDDFVAVVERCGETVAEIMQKLPEELVLALGVDYVKEQVIERLLARAKKRVKNERDRDLLTRLLASPS